jgi:hypothetical protein
MILATAATALSVTNRLRRERDVARQVTLLMDAELAARNGKWHNALQYLDQAESAGYSDTVSLGLARVEALNALNLSHEANSESSKLLQQPNLGVHRGAVLLRLGESELEDIKTFEQGKEHIREASFSNLEPVDTQVATGLLADCAENALTHMQEALTLDPHCLAAHRYSLELEFLLAHKEEFATHVRIFEMLYPDDSLPFYLKGAERAVNHNLQDVDLALAPVKRSLSPGAWNRYVSNLRLFSELSKRFALSTIIEQQQAATNPNQLLFINYPASLLASNNDDVLPYREPNLPCIRDSFVDGMVALNALDFPWLGYTTLSIERIKTSWRKCPEAWIPFRAAIILQSHQATDSSPSIPVLLAEAELFQLAADSPAVDTSLQKASCYLAAKAESQLIASGTTNLLEEKTRCLRNLKAAAGDRDLPVTAFERYADIALRLGEFEIARELQDRSREALRIK